MTYFINEACVDELDLSCVEECPVDCIYEGARKLYINPRECIDCGACEAVCPVLAIKYHEDVDDLTQKEDNARFFSETLPGRSEPLGNPGGARKIGKIPSDTELIAQL